MLNEKRPTSPPTPKRYPEWERAVRPPSPLPPPKSCDCQAHIFGDVAKYPTQPGAAYIPPAASFDDLCAVEKTLGFERFVVVHSTLYGADHRLAIDVLEALTDSSHVRLISRVDGFNQRCRDRTARRARRLRRPLRLPP
jgi:predicted TIM-barrel fold metal-dependent hydrolase